MQETVTISRKGAMLEEVQTLMRVGAVPAKAITSSLADAVFDALKIEEHKQGMPYSDWDRV